MTRMLAVLVLLSLGLAPGPARAPSSPYSGPIIEVHLHGGTVSEWGVEPPVGICAPFAHFRTWDPAQCGTSLAGRGDHVAIWRRGRAPV
jgi:hypothetical protein